jgi:uracil-DNA glycosylase family 4
MLLYQHVLQDLRLAGLTDIITDTPCDFTQRQERNPFKTAPIAAEKPLAPQAEVTILYQQPLPPKPQPLRVAEPPRPALVESPAPDMTNIVRLQVQQGAKAWVALADNDLSDNFMNTNHGEFLTKMLRGIKLEPTQVNIIRFAEMQQGRRLSTAHVLQVGEYVAPQVKQSALPVLILGQGALQVMLGQDKPMAAVHGQVLNLPLGHKAVATYHPSILQERTELKRRAWDALQAFHNLLAPGV